MVLRCFQCGSRQSDLRNVQLTSLDSLRPSHRQTPSFSDKLGLQGYFHSLEASEVGSGFRQSLHRTEHHLIPSCPFPNSLTRQPSRLHDPQQCKERGTRGRPKAQDRLPGHPAKSPRPTGRAVSGGRSNQSCNSSGSCGCHTCTRRSSPRHRGSCSI